MVIVALPAVDEKVGRISSEKVPHLTIAFLGDQSNSNSLVEIVEFVQHAASQLSPFGMTVDHRGTLGPDDADVLFFEDNRWDLDRIKQFRAHLLQNDSIARAYASVEQYPEWTPHLTLGYPETPANEDDSDYPGIHYVSFDRIAVWLGDSEGPTFRLKYEAHGMDVAMSDMTTAERGEAAADSLFHFGKKGMKWGVTSEKTGSNREWKKDAKSSETANQAFQNAMTTAGPKIEELNNNPLFKGKDLTQDPTLARQYDSLVDSTINDHLAQASIDLTLNSKGHAFIYQFDRSAGMMRATEYKMTAEHSDTKPFPDLKVEMDALGHIVSFAVSELKHYGKKGMKWGVTTVDKASSPTLTREKKALRNSKDVTVTQRKAGTYAKAKGGQRQKASDDAVKAVAARQKAKKSTTDSLTNPELKAAVERMQLEQQFSKLDASVKRRGQSFIAQLFSSPEARKTTADLLARANETNKK